MFFHNGDPNSNVATFIEFLVNALSKQQVIANLQAEHTYKQHTASPENSLYLLLNKN